MELFDVRVRYSSGQPFWDEDEQAWRYEAEEVPLVEAPDLLDRIVGGDAASELRQTIFTLLGPDGHDVLADGADADTLILDTVPLAKQVAWEDAVRDAVNEGSEPPPRPTSRVPKLLSRDKRVIATNAIYVEAMLGKCTACEDFVRDSRVLEIEARQLDNHRAELDLHRAEVERQRRDDESTRWHGLRFDGLPDSAQVRVFVGKGAARQPVDDEDE